MIILTAVYVRKNKDVFGRMFQRLINHRISLLIELKNSIMTRLEKVRYNENMIVCSTVIARLIGRLESGKSSGPYGISPESLKFC